MKDRLNTGFENRLKVAAEAKRALIAQLQAQPAKSDPDHEERAKLRAAELAARRKAHSSEKQLRREAAAAAETEAQRVRQEADDAALLLRRGQVKERKALSAADAKAKRDAKYAARKARQ